MICTPSWAWLLPKCYQVVVGMCTNVLKITYNPTFSASRVWYTWPGHAKLSWDFRGYPEGVLNKFLLPVPGCILPKKKHLFQNFSLENLQEWTWGSWDDFGAVWFVDFSCWPLLSLLIKFGSGIRQTKNACCRGVEILLVSSWYNFDTHESSDVLTPMVRTDSIVAFSYALISDHKVN